MRITSRAGNFIMTIEDISVENDELVMTGKMGVWSAKTMLNAEELDTMLREVKISGKAMRFLARHMARYGAGRVASLASAPWRMLSRSRATDSGAPESKDNGASESKQ